MAVVGAKTAVQRLAMYIAEEGGHLGFHEDRWYSDEQRERFEKSARNIITLLNNDGYRIIPKSAVDWLMGEVGSFEPSPGAKGAFWWRTEFRRRAGLK